MPWHPGAKGYPGHPNITELVVGLFFANLRRQVVGCSNLRLPNSILMRFLAAFWREHNRIQCRSEIRGKGTGKVGVAENAGHLALSHSKKLGTEKYLGNSSFF